MTFVLAGICWVKNGFWSSDDRNSCWLEESDLLAVAAVRSKRWNQPSAPTATTKFWQPGKAEDARHTMSLRPLWHAAASLAAFLTFPLLQTSPIATQVSWKTKTHYTSKKKSNWLCEVLTFYPRDPVTVQTMPTQVLVIQGLESSFLYTRSFPLVSPTTSSFSYNRQTSGLHWIMTN